MSNLELFNQALDEFSRKVKAVKPGQWEEPTPDDQWSVRQLVNHVAGEQLWVPEMMAGRTMAAVGDKFDGDILGDDPEATWEKAAAGAHEAFGKTGALDKTVHLSFGDVPGSAYLEQMLIDLVIHGWDLARGISADDRIAPELTAAVYKILEPQAEAWRSGGAFGPKIESPKGADLQTKLLNLTGRSA